MRIVDSEERRLRGSENESKVSLRNEVTERDEFEGDIGPSRLHSTI